VATPAAELPAAYSPVPIPFDTLALLLVGPYSVKCFTIGFGIAFGPGSDLSLFLLKERTPASISRAHLAAKWSGEQAMNDNLSIIFANIESEDPGICWPMCSNTLHFDSMTKIAAIVIMLNKLSGAVLMNANSDREIVAINIASLSTRA